MDKAIEATEREFSKIRAGDSDLSGRKDFRA